MSRRLRGHRGEVRILGWSDPGPPAHPVFPVGAGLTGEAIRTRSTVVSGDVRSDPRYLTAFGTTRSEMIVPVLMVAAVVGTIDVESEEFEAFGDDDRLAIERCAAAIRPLYAEE